MKFPNRLPKSTSPEIQTKLTTGLSNEWPNKSHKIQKKFRIHCRSQFLEFSKKCWRIQNITERKNANKFPKDSLNNLQKKISRKFSNKLPKSSLTEFLTKFPKEFPKKISNYHKLPKKCQVNLLKNIKKKQIICWKKSRNNCFCQFQLNYHRHCQRNYYKNNRKKCSHDCQKNVIYFILENLKWTSKLICRNKLYLNF